MTSTLPCGASTFTGRSSVTKSLPSSGFLVWANTIPGRPRAVVAKTQAAPAEKSRRFMSLSLLLRKGLRPAQPEGSARPVPGLALHPHQRGFDAAGLEFFLLPVGVFLLVERPHTHAEHLAPGLLTLGDLGIHTHQRELGPLGFGILGRAESAGLDEIEERVRAGGSRPCRGQVAQRVGRGLAPDGRCLGCSLAGGWDGGDGRRRHNNAGRRWNGFGRVLAVQRRVGIPVAVLAGFRSILFGRAALPLVEEGNRDLGHVNRYGQGRGQAQHHPDDDADDDRACLSVLHCLISCAYILRGALTPSTARPLCNTWAVAATSASRALRTCTSSTRMRSAS